MPSRQIRSAVVLMILVFTALLLFHFRTLCLTKIGTWIVREDRAEPSDAIVLLNGMFPRDVLAAAGLYRQKLAPQIVITPERWPDGFNELRKRRVKIEDATEQQVDALIQMGVPKGSIVLLDTVAESTRQEA